MRRLCYRRAFLPDSGATTLALADSIGATFVRSNIREGFIMPSWVTDDHAIPRDVPQPLRTFTDTLRLVNAAARHILATYILTFEPTVTPDPFQRFAHLAAALGCLMYRMPA